MSNPQNPRERDDSNRSDRQGSASPGSGSRQGSGSQDGSKKTSAQPSIPGRTSSDREGRSGSDPGRSGSEPDRKGGSTDSGRSGSSGGSRQGR